MLCGECEPRLPCSCFPQPTGLERDLDAIDVLLREECTLYVKPPVDTAKMDLTVFPPATPNWMLLTQQFADHQPLPFDFGLWSSEPLSVAAMAIVTVPGFGDGTILTHPAPNWSHLIQQLAALQCLLLYITPGDNTVSDGTTDPPLCLLQRCGPTSV